MDKETYEKKVHFFGRTSVILFMFGTTLLPLTLFLKFGILPEKTAFITGATTILGIMVIVSLAEFLSYAPIIGSAGIYIMSITGNTSNIKIPSSVAAMEAVGVDPASEEGEIISTLSIGMSTITTEIVILAGVILLAPFSDVFQNSALTPAFEQIVPALFGGLMITSILKSPRLSVIPIVVALLVMYMISFPFGEKLAYFSIPITVIVTLIFTRVAYNMGLLSPNKN